MIGKLLGIGDILTAILFNFYNNFGLFPTEWVLVFGIYLLIKGGLFSLSLDIASIIDVICAILMLGSLHFNFILPGIAVGIIGIYLIIKGLMSLMM